MKAPETSWVMATTMQGRASRFSMTCPLVSGGMELIRPLYLVREDDIKAWRDYNGLHFIQCACKFTDTCTTCNNEENRSKRVEIKELIKNLKKVNPFERFIRYKIPFSLRIFS